MVVLDGVAALAAGDVEYVNEHARALDVTEEIVAEAHALAGAFDKAGDVGHDEAALAEADDAEVGLEGGEVVIGDLRARRRHRR